MASPILGMSEWKTRVNDLYMMATLCHWTHAELMAQTQTRIYAELNRKHGKRGVYSLYLKGYVQGLRDAWMDKLYAQHLEFCYCVDGVLYSTHKTSSHALTESLLGTETYQHLVERSSAHGHYWLGTDKPFFN